MTDPLTDAAVWVITGYDLSSGKITMGFDASGGATQLDIGMGTGLSSMNILFSLGGQNGMPNALSWFGAAPVTQQPVEPEAVDLPSAVCLVNSIRTLLLNYGLAVPST